MNTYPVTPCDYAKIYYLNALKWLNLWNILVYAFAATIILFSITAILLFIRSNWLPGALSTLGTIASSTGITWVVNQRTTSVKEVKDAFKILKKECWPPGFGFVGIEEQPWFGELHTLARKSLFWSGKRLD